MFKKLKYRLFGIVPKDGSLKKYINSLYAKEIAKKSLITMHIKETTKQKH